VHVGRRANAAHRLAESRADDLAPVALDAQDDGLEVLLALERAGDADDLAGLVLPRRRGGGGRCSRGGDDEGEQRGGPLPAVKGQGTI
jgi:hypothetical protein